MKKNTLVCFITHLPLFEICFPILEGLQKRGDIDVRLVLARRLLKTEPRISDALKASGIVAEISSRLAIEAFSYFKIRSADAVLTHVDPIAHRKKTRLRDRFVPKAGTPSIYIQHGMMQMGLNYAHESFQDLHWYSKLLLVWDDFSINDYPFHADNIEPRTRKSGFTKKFCFKPRPVSKEYSEFASGFKKRILLCNCFPGQTFRYSESDLIEYYDLFDAFCARNPDVLVLQRPHRGKQDDLGRRYDSALVEKHRNFILSDRYDGEFSYSTIQDCLAQCDGLISHASTAVLDGVYDGKPTAVLNNDWPALETLPQVSDMESLETFAQMLPTAHRASNLLLPRFGEIEANITKACIEIESFLRATR